MIVLDTNALIRFFTNDSPAQSTRVRLVLESGQNVKIPDVVFPELEYVLKRLYQRERAQLLEIFTILLAHPSLKVSAQVRKAVDLFATSKLDMADCLIAASIGPRDTILSFDQELLKTLAKTKQN